MKEIGKSAFEECNYIKSLIIPDSVVTIGDAAFRNCTGISNIVIGNNVTKIGSNCFNQCTSLKYVTIPASVTHIGAYAFYTYSLQRVTFEDTSTWYRTTNFSEWTYKTNGTKTDLTDSWSNAKFFKDFSYYNYYWFKK